MRIQTKRHAKRGLPIADKLVNSLAQLVHGETREFAFPLRVERLMMLWLELSGVHLRSVASRMAARAHARMKAQAALDKISVLKRLVDRYPLVLHSQTVQHVITAVRMHETRANDKE